MTMPLTPRQEIWRGLLHGQRSMLLRLGADLKRDFDLSLAQYEALLALFQSPGRSLSATGLARELLYSSGSATHLMRRLSERGLVRRSVDAEDARTHRVHLTEAGADLIERATASHVAALAEQFEPLIADADVPALLGFARAIAAHEGVRSAPPLAEPGVAESRDGTG
ncbi:MarR family winged helix-turn-helix transcriptional regulator [Leucobacter sp. M11]|uniref:MarR family winged helix-turn-helix transcriptional regulator n=1 Tax=Leucobacter sp. M11 TaxID=2993565 RepID=UPI002D7FD23B|nr:MarR family transcriptional regulator [Leucobacter sp. M11]MEB4614585.1 MarR family transcriptional regulator [Leucobacter sp. M11]